jgi:hypothetical protein
MTIELNTLSPKKWVANYSGSAPTIDTTDGVRVGDFAIDTSNSAIWQCTDNTDTAAVWVLKNVSGIPLTGSSAITGSLIPTTDNDIDLGDATHQWRDLYLSGATMYLGGSTIEKNGELLEWDGYKLLDTNSSLMTDISNLNATDPSSVSDNGAILGKAYITASGYGDESDGSITVPSSTTYDIEDYGGANTDIINSGMNVGISSFTVRSPTGFSIGDKCYLHQTQIGNGGSLSQRGQYEEIEISGISGSIINLLNPTVNAYVNNSSGNIIDNPKVQLVKIVELTTLTLTSSDSYLSCKPWDGFSGGLIALRVINLVGDGHITASGKGFRGGPFSGNKAGEGWSGLAPSTSVNNSGGNGNGGLGCGGGGSHSTADTSSAGVQFYGANSGDTYGFVAVDLLTNLNFGGGGGGYSLSSFNREGGDSGGGIILRVSDYSVFNGTILANGNSVSQAGNVDRNAGAGSGGSALVLSPTVFPGARILVSGGASIEDGGAGGTGYEYAEIPVFTDTADWRVIGKIDTDVLLGSGSSSDSLVPTQLAVKTYVDLAAGSVIITDSGAVNLVVIGTTTDTTPTPLTLDGNPEGATGSLIIPVDTAWAFTVHVVGIDSTNGFANSKKFSFDGLALNDGGTVTVTSSTLGTDASQGTFTGSVSLTADATNDALRVLVVGIGTDTIIWSARVNIIQVN